MGTTFTLNRINQDLPRGTQGNDIVQGSPDRPSIRNGKMGEIRLLQGDDIIRSSNNIRVYGSIGLGSGRGVIVGGRSVSLLYDVRRGLEAGFVQTGRGADRIEASGGPFLVGEDSHLEMGGGHDEILVQDLILAAGFLRTGEGEDRIDVGDGRISDFLGSLDLGDGDDILIARGGLADTGEGIRVTMGAGDDLVDVSRRGIDSFLGFGSTTLNLGPGDDRLIGFAQAPKPWQLDQLDVTPPGVVRGGKGKDVIALPEGVYVITADLISTEETFLLVAGFNVLKGVNGGRFLYTLGVPAVGELGTASFAPAL